jgi:hypothetical protein
MTNFGKFPGSKGFTMRLTITERPKKKRRAYSGPKSPEEAMSWHPEPAKQDSPEACAEKIAELDALFVAFQSKYDLESLHAINYFATPEERRASPRAQALVDMGPIVKLVNYLEDQHAVSREAFAYHLRHYRILQNTVIGALRDSPDGIGEIVVHRKVNEDGSIEG